MIVVLLLSAIPFSIAHAEVQEGGNVITDLLILDEYDGYSYSYTLTGWSLDAGVELIGLNGSGVFTLDGASGSSNTLNYAYYLELGVGIGSHGTYNLGAGWLTSNEQIIGNYGTGDFIQSTPLNSYNTTGSLSLGKRSSGVGTYTMVGGWLTAGSETIGYQATAHLPNGAGSIASQAI